MSEAIGVPWDYAAYLLAITGLGLFFAFFALMIWDDYDWQRDMPNRIVARLKRIEEKRGE